MQHSQLVSVSGTMEAVDAVLFGIKLLLRRSFTTASSCTASLYSKDIYATQPASTIAFLPLVRAFPKKRTKIFSFAVHHVMRIGISCHRSKTLNDFTLGDDLMSHHSMQPAKCLISCSLLVLVLVNVGHAQRGSDSPVEARLRSRGGQEAVERYRARLASERAAAPNWAEALQHPELSVRYQAMQELQAKAYKGEPLTDAVEVLRKCANQQLHFGSRDETLMMQQRAFEILGVVDQDFAASRMARYLASNLHVGQYGPREQNIAMGVLEKINHVSVNLDEDLLRALGRARARDRRQQVNSKRPEAMLLYVTAKLSKDKRRAGQAVLDAMRWPLSDPDCYERHHFLAVRYAAEHCGSLLPRLVRAYRTSNRLEYLHMIAALAVHHDEAWNFFENYLQDGFVNQYNKRSMATAFADSWLLASKETQRSTAAKATQLNTKTQAWLDWRSTDTQRLLYYSKKKADVMELFRKGIGYKAPKPYRPFEDARR